MSVLWLFIGAVGDKGLCGESNTRAQAFVEPTEKGRKIEQPNAMRDESSLVSRVVEKTLVEQNQILERGREKIDILADRLTPNQRSEPAQGEAAQAPQSAPAWERKPPLETNTDRSGTALKSLNVRLPRRSKESSMRCGQRLKRRGSSKSRRLIKSETGQTPLRVNLPPSGRNSMRRGS